MEAVNLTTLRRRAAPGLIDRGVEVDTTIIELLAANEPVAVGVSGGKDSVTAAIAVVEHLRAIGHAGPVVLVHSDLGDPDPALNVEWDDSLPTCERLAAFLGVELVIVRRPAGGMMKRWLGRWENNKKRYANLQCVKMILPWSTPSMRFCTSELKSAPIASALVKRFPGRRIISACGIRREEGRGKDSSPRTNAPTSKPNKRLTNKTAHTSGVDWNPIAAWTESDVFAYCAARGFQMHEGYGLGMSRISCRFCIMQDISDQRVSASVVANRPVGRTIVDLEIASTFGFQGSRWLSDVMAAHLDAATLAAVASSKERAARREAIEDQIPDHLLFEEGWPKVMPTQEEAELLCRVRREIAALYGIEVAYVEPAKLIARYAELMALNAAKEAAKAKRKRGAGKRTRKTKKKGDPC
jgi:3'-phosphoadenosine 5'-phosphosulfate sulfotransferase (PAPS reductase)/FAD synthetase